MSDIDANSEAQKLVSDKAKAIPNATSGDPVAAPTENS